MSRTPTQVPNMTDSLCRAVAALLFFVGVLAGSSAHASPVKGRDWKAHLASAALLEHKTLAVARAKSMVASLSIHAAVHTQKVAHAAPYYPPAKYLVNGPVVPAVIPTNVPEPAKTAAFLSALEARWAANPTQFDANHPTLGAMFAAQVILQKATISGMFTAGQLAQVEQAFLPNTPYYQYFEARRSIDPTRFDTYHPLLGPVIAENQILHNMFVSAQNIVPIPAGGGGGSGPAAVPEPGPLALAGVALSVLAALRHTRGRIA